MLESAVELRQSTTELRGGAAHLARSRLQLAPQPRSALVELLRCRGDPGARLGAARLARADEPLDLGRALRQGSGSGGSALQLGLHPGEPAGVELAELAADLPNARLDAGDARDVGVDGARQGLGPAGQSLSVRVQRASALDVGGDPRVKAGRTAGKVVGAGVEGAQAASQLRGPRGELAVTGARRGHVRRQLVGTGVELAGPGGQLAETGVELAGR